MTHLDLDETLALIEAEAAPVHPHLVACARCRAEVDAGRAALAEVAAVTVPEPSPLFWDVLSRRVSEQVASETPGRLAVGWPFWRVLVPLSMAVGALLIAVAVDQGGRQRVLPPTAVVAPLGDDPGAAPASADGEWAVLVHLAGDFDPDTLADSFGRPGERASESAIWELNAQERMELAALLRLEMEQ
jgi:hypothetical protein